MGPAPRTRSGGADGVADVRVVPAAVLAVAREDQHAAVGQQVHLHARARRYLSRPAPAVGLPSSPGIAIDRSGVRSLG